jgi:hypothetical protein
MSERVTTAMLDNAMEYLAELMGTNFAKNGEGARQGSITYYNSNTNENGRFYRFGVYRWYNEYNNGVITRKLATHDPEGYKSYTKRDLHTAIRFMCAALYAVNGIMAKDEGKATNAV